MLSDLNVGLINNTCLLLTAGVIYFAFSFDTFKFAVSKRVFFGFVFGIIGIFIMSTPIRLIEGVMFDTRTILISVVGLFFGLVPTAIAAVIMCLYRLYLGGAGVVMGVSTILFTAITGLLWNRFRLKKILKKHKNIWVEFYGFGVLTHIVMLLCTVLLPREVMFELFQEISVPVIVIYPIVWLYFGNCWQSI